MSKLSPSAVFQLLVNAGFSPAAATTMVAISGAETGGAYDTAVLGDVNLETSVWGPSFGLFQIRTEKRKTGTNTARDIAWLADPVNQARAAYEISNGGRDFSPWSTYTSGKYRQYLSGQSATAQTTTPLESQTGDGTGISGWKALALETVFVLGGISLLVYGGYRLT